MGGFLPNAARSCDLRPRRRPGMLYTGASLLPPGVPRWTPRESAPCLTVRSLAMTRNPGPTERPAPLSPGELFLRYLNRQAEAQASGLGPAEPVGEVEPYESVAEQPVDARLAWSDAIAAASFLGAPAAEWPVPPDWPALVAAPEPAVAVP